MAELEFPLAQGWTKGLTIAFENTHESAQYNWDQTFHLKQVHGADVLNVPTQLSPRLIGEGDGMVCDGEWLKENKFRLAIKTADCLPLFYIETLQKKICAIHAGWRGLQQKIHLWPFEKGGFDPVKTWVWLGPSLNGIKFEVKEDMWSQFPVETQQDSEIFSTHGITRTFSPWKLVARDFRMRKVELLYNVELNTYDDPKWASYRRKCHQEVESGRPILYQQNMSWVGVL